MERARKFSITYGNLSLTLVLSMHEVSYLGQERRQDQYVLVIYICGLEFSFVFTRISCLFRISLLYSSRYYTGRMY